MNILITGGHTEVPIDKVRCISNIFHGKTAIDIAKEACLQKHSVTLVGNESMFVATWDRFRFYKTFDELEIVMEQEIKSNFYDCVIHSAAVSDYTVSRVLDDPNMMPIDNTGKVGSNYSKLYLEMVPTRKIVDEIRNWGFKGILVKFKLQVDMPDEELIRIAHKSMQDSCADVIVANCLEWAKDRAYILTKDVNQSVSRKLLAPALLNIIEEMK